MTLKIPEFTFEPQHLDEQCSRVIVHLIVTAQKGEEVLLEDAEVAQEFLAQVLLKRISGYGLPFKITNLFFIASVITFANNPGKIMGLLWLCRQEWQKTRRTIFDITCWCEAMFPHGVPSEADIRKWWDSQKDNDAPLGNLVDNVKLWHKY